MPADPTRPAPRTTKTHNRIALNNAKPMPAPNTPPPPNRFLNKQKFNRSIA